MGSAWGALAVGFIHGMVFFGLLLYWISVIGVVAWLPLTTVLAALASGYSLLIWSFRHWPAGRWWLIAVAGWGLWEFVRARFPLDGFPWGSLGYGAAANPGFIGATQWIGPGGWGLLAAAVAAGLVLVIESQDHWSLLGRPARDRFHADARRGPVPAGRRWAATPSGDRSGRFPMSGHTLSG